MNDNLKPIYLYSDGGASPNPGVGGFGVILKFGNYSKEFYQGYQKTTNNRMELMAVIYGLKKIKKPNSTVIITSDSKYIINAIEKGWLKQWKLNDWYRNKNKKGKKILNIDLWKSLYELLNKHKIRFNWVKGHSGHRENEICDKLASIGRSQKKLNKDIEYLKEIKEESKIF